MNNARRRVATLLAATFAATAVIGLFGAAVTPAVASAQSADLTPTVNPTPAHYGSVETLSTPGLVDATGSLSYTDQFGDWLCAATLPDTSCTYTNYQAMPGDTLTVTSNYLDADANPVGTGSVDVPVTASDVTATITTPQQVVPYNSAVEFDLNGFPTSGAYGTVYVKDQNGNLLCQMGAGETSCLAYPTPGDYTYTGHYSGDNVSNPATFAGGTLTVAKGESTVAASADASGYSNPVNFRVGSLPVDATGTVAIRDANNGLLCTVSLAESYDCNSTAGSLPAGQVTVTVNYSGDDNYQASTGTETFTINKALTADFTTSGSGNYVQGRTQTVLSVRGLPADATGTVTFEDDNYTTLCTVTVPSAHSCSPAKNLPIGDYHARAIYSGDNNYDSTNASNDEISFTVIDPETVKTPVKLTAAVNPATPDYLHSGKVTIGGLPSKATGTVTIVYPYAYQPHPCVAKLNGAGSVTCTLPTKQEPGQYLLVATYNGDNTYQHGTVSKHYTIAKSVPTMKLTADKTSYHYGSFETFHVLGMNKTQNGRVTFTDEHGKPVCSPTSPQPYNGVVTCPVINLAAGTHTVTATYTGDAHYTSGKTSIKITVLPALPKPKFAITVANGKHLVGKPVTILISGLPKSATGRLGFFDEHGNLLCGTKSPASRCVVSGSHLHALGAGKHLINGLYSGNAKFSPVQVRITITMSRK